ncbi:hypothetical protein L0P88_05345 [Muricauda sp. SCSIO 64092]|uniref:hypothetical protein n=1 Tax=Allomuricauda sp. SCSIO 64092 TaxID=2908842 RepID=UPI001FF6A11C|nr:hypothetical protein [Muricauda sp. SCSIO 64092]UOY07976.1 hypothetical protein L0P88_05345 [Muricauda sp. SCSIO 64092]
MQKLGTLVLLLVAQSIWAQRTTIGLLTFEANRYQDFQEADLLTERVKEIFFESKRFRPIDRTAYAEANKYREGEIQKNIEYINGYVTEQGIKDGAKFIVGGKLIALSYSKTKDGSFKCDMSFSISINDIETNELIATKTFNPGGPLNFKLSGGTETQAMVNTLRAAQKDIENYIINNVPFIAPIQQIDPVKKSAEVLIVAGKNEGVNKGDRFGIYQVTEIETVKGLKVRKELVAKFPIKVVEGDFSKAFVGKNATELLDKYNDDTIKLICQSMPKSGLSL